jgi:predicted transcriptional regulator
MNKPTRSIEVDEATAKALDALAGERGVTVSAVVSDLVALGADTILPTAAELEELRRQSAAIRAGEATVTHDEVVRWVGTIGTPAYRPWHKR